MRTGNKIAWIYTWLMMGLVCLVGLLFYLLTAHSINRIYNSFLAERANATAVKLWEKDELDEVSYALVKKRYEQTLPSTQEIILNADSAGTRNTLSHYLGEEQIKSLFEGELIYFDQNKDRQGVALYYPDNEGNFIILILSNNRYGEEILNRMGWFLLAALLITALLIHGVGKFYASRVVNKIDEAYQSEKSFISNASHELNNPLTAILGECEITLLKPRTPDEYQSALQRIADETRRIITLMKHLLFLSRGDQEILRSVIEPIRLDTYLKELAEEYAVPYTSDGTATLVNANPHLLDVAIRNILNNALKYSDGKTVRISLTERQVTIADQGIGIPKKEIKRIFQPFYRGKNARDFKGNGIGLSLSYRILRLYGAHLHIESKEGKGTQAHILFD